MINEQYTTNAFYNTDEIVQKYLPPANNGGDVIKRFALPVINTSLYNTNSIIKKWER